MAVPERRVSNDEIAELIGVDEGWIAKRTGTRERPWAVPGERMSAFAARAGQEALARAGLEPGELAEREGRLRPGDRVLLAAFGGGFTWGATTVRWGPGAARG